MKPMRPTPPLSLEKSRRRQEICTAIGQQLREYYKQSQPLSEGLANLLKKIEQSDASVALSRDGAAGSPKADCKEQD